MGVRERSAALWGVVGGLAFLVLVQAYRLLAGSLGLGLWSALGVALVVGVAVGVGAYATENRLASKGRT